MNRKIALAVGAGVIAAGGVLASAATLGTLDVKTLGTSSAAVTGCASNNVQVEWNLPTAPNYSGSATVGDSTFTTTDLRVTVPAACVGATMRLVVANSAGAPLGTATVPSLVDGVNDVTIAGVNSKLIEQTTVTIYNET
jgi:hypothetical protein